MAKVGGCVLAESAGEVPADAFAVSIVGAAPSEFAFFALRANSCGCELLAEPGVPEEFVALVASTAEEMLKAGSDSLARTAVARRLWRHKALLPLFHTEPKRVAFPEHSVCDVVLFGHPRQAMEVLEHVLHTLTDVGLAMEWPERWGFEDSEAARLMLLAVERGVYSLHNYADIGHTAVRQRVCVQEFVYWLLTTGWDLQVRYGKPSSREWFAGARLPSATELWARLPEAKPLFDAAAPALGPPPVATLDRLQALGVV